MPKRKTAPALEDYVFVKQGAKGEQFEAFLVREEDGQQQPSPSSPDLVCVQWVIRGGRAYVNASDVTPMHGLGVGGRERRCRREKEKVTTKKEPSNNSAKLKKPCSLCGSKTKAAGKKAKVTVAPPNGGKVVDLLNDTSGDEEDERSNVRPSAAFARKPKVFYNQKHLRMKGNAKDDPIDLLGSSGDESWRLIKSPSPARSASAKANGGHVHGRQRKTALKLPPKDMGLKPPPPHRKYARKHDPPSRAFTVKKKASIDGTRHHAERVYVQPRVVPAPKFGEMIREDAWFQQLNRQGKPVGGVDLRVAGISQFTAKRFGNRFPRLIQLIPQTGPYKSIYRAENDGFRHLPDQARVVTLKKQQYKDSDDEAEMLDSEGSDDDSSTSLSE